MGKTHDTFVATDVASLRADLEALKARKVRDARPARPSERPEAIVVDEEVEMASESGPATATGKRGLKYAPLEAIPPRPPQPEPAVRVRNLYLPKVVGQVLDDCREHWEHLAKSLEGRCSTDGLKSVLVASSLQGEGCTTIATCLAVALARCTSKKVMLVDADFTRPGVCDSLKLKCKVGLEQVLIEGTSNDDAIVASEKPPLAIMPLVHGFEFPAMALQNDKLGDTMESLRGQCDIMVVDGGCVFAGKNPMPLTVGIDAAVLVRHPSISSEHLLDQLDAYLSERGVCGLGVIENCVE